MAPLLRDPVRCKAFAWIDLAMAPDPGPMLLRLQGSADDQADLCAGEAEIISKKMEMMEPTGMRWC